MLTQNLKDPSLVKPSGKFIHMMRWQTVCFRSHDQVARLHQFKKERRHDLDAPAKVVRLFAQSHRRCPPWLAGCGGGVQMRGLAVRDSGRLIRNPHECRRELKGSTDPDADSSAKSATHGWLRG